MKKKKKSSANTFSKEFFLLLFLISLALPSNGLRRAATTTKNREIRQDSHLCYISKFKERLRNYSPNYSPLVQRAVLYILKKAGWKRREEKLRTRQTRAETLEHYTYVNNIIFQCEKQQRETESC